MNWIKKLLLFFFFVIFYNRTTAQTGDDDSSLYNASLKYATDNYHKAVYPEIGLYNGREYINYNFSFREGQPYFESDNEDSAGSIVYDGILYEKVPLMLNLVTEQVIINDPSGVHRISLNNDRVSSFTLFNHNFVRLTEDSLNKNEIRTGFYDMLYKGKIFVFKKIQKEIDEKLSVTEGSLIRVYEHDNYYIKKEDRFYSISTKKQVLHVLKDRRKELQQFIRKNRLKIRKHKDRALPAIAGWYDSINK